MSSATAEDLLRVFFGEANDLSYEDAVASAKFDELTPWIEDLRSGRTFVMLPRVRDGSTTWYGMASSALGLRELRELLGAFVGPTYTSFRGASLPLNPQDPVDAAVERFSEGRVVKLEVWPRGDRDHQESVRQRLFTMRALRIGAPSRKRAPERPTWRVIRDLELALGDNDRDAAESYLEELSSGHALGEPNLTFLRIRLFSEFDRWEELLDLGELPWLLRVSRPPQVTAAILEAIYEVEVAPILARGTDIEAVASRIESIYGRLLHADPRVLTSATVSVVMLAASYANPVREDQYRRLQLRAAENGIDIDERIVEPTPAVLAAEQRVPFDSIEAAERALEEGDHDAALELAKEAEPSQRKAWILVRCASSIQSLSSARAALEAIERLPEAERSTIEESPIVGPLVENLNRMATGEGKIPKGWIEWAESVANGPDFGSPRDVAERGAAEWDSALSDSELQRFANAIGTAPDHEAHGIVRSVPQILAAFPIDGARSAHLNLYLALLQRLAVGGQVSAQDLVSSFTMLDGILHIGPDTQQYEDLVDLCQMLWEAAASPSAIDWLLDAMHVLAHHPSPAPERRRSFVITAINRLSQWPSSLDPPAREGLASVSEVIDIELSELLTPPQDDRETAAGFNPWRLLAGKRVGIYTLTESAAARAMDVISRLAPSAQIDTNDDHVCTDRLASLASNADLMVLVTQSATHAASDCVDAHRGAGPTIHPKGKGTSAIIRAIEDELRALALTPS